MSSTSTVPQAEARPKGQSARRVPKYPGIRVTCNGNFLVTQYVETRITEGGVFYPITPSTEGGEIYQQSFASGELNVWDAQQVADQGIIMRKVNELSLNPGMNIQDGMLTTHSERMYLAPEAEFLREYLGACDEQIDCPTPAQRELFGPKRRRVPQMMDLKNPILLGPVQNQEHHMNGVVARRNNFNEPILGFLKDAYAEFGRLTGRVYGFITEYKTEDADTVFVSLGCAAENIDAAC